MIGIAPALGKMLSSASNLAAPTLPSEGRGRMFESSRAPPSTHLRTPGLTALACKNGLLEQVLASLDPDLVVVHLDHVD